MSTVTVSNLSLKAPALSAVSALLPQVVALDAFAKPIQSFSRDRLGETVVVPVNASGLTASAFNENTQNYLVSAAGSHTVDGVAVILDTHLISDATQHSLVDLTTGVVDMDEIVRSHISAVIDAAALSLYGDITVANFDAIGTAVAQANFDIDDLIDYEIACNDLNWGPMGRKLVLSDGYLGNIKKGSWLVALQNSEANAGNVALKFQPLHGFDVLPSNVIKRSATALGAEKLRGFVTDGTGLAFASAFPASSEGMGGTIKVQRVSLGGLSIQVKAKIVDATEKVAITAETYFGKKLLRAAGLKRILST